VHGLHLDAPMGSAVIQTVGQYKYYQDRKEEVNRKYLERMKLQKLHQNEPVLFVAFIRK